MDIQAKQKKSWKLSYLNEKQSSFCADSIEVPGVRYTGNATLPKICNANWNKNQ